ncbi:MAG: TAXI family TRAP transporter solute-binding subunit [Rhodobacteraceae bacterium]|nr:MAG: TAXI family TRAP transporter solute-binding subunit [Paracoccaceae bacterium]
MSMTRRAAIAGAALAAVVSASGAGAQSANYILATASTGGTYYPVGVAIATLTKVRLEPSEGIGMSAISSAGSGENIRLMREGEAQFSILQGLFGYFAAEGVGPVEADGPQENLRSVAGLWPNVEHFVVGADHAETGTIADFVGIKGRSAALGAQNSGTIGSNRIILGNLGVNIDEDFTLVYGGYGPAAEALQNGQVAGISTPAGVPVGALTQLFAAASDRVRLLTFSPEQVEEADGGFNLWTAYDIPAGTYPGQDYDVVTIAQPNFLAVNADVPEEHVYQITRTMFENLAFLRAIHPATEEFTLETALNGLPLPLHPGALRYFQEIGVDVPARLIAE